MPNGIIDSLKNFRDKIYQFFPRRRDAAMELVDSLSSNTTARSIVELSLNPLHRRNYCSITRVLDEFHQSQDSKNRQWQHQQLMKLIAAICPPLNKQPYHVFGVDCTSSPRMFSPTLKDRSFVYAPNIVSGNKPVTIGHQYSIAAYFPDKSSAKTPPWIIPMSCERIGTNQKGTLVGMKQISACIQSQESFKRALCISVGDSAYSHPDCIAESETNPNQIHISRARNNRNFYYPLKQNKKLNRRGRPKQYGGKYCLGDKETWEIPNECVEFELFSKKGKCQKIKIECWNEIIMRGNKISSVSDCHFRLLRICVYKESGELLFKRPLWLIASGIRRDELTLKDIFNIYRQRFDIEHFFRFGKNRLLMNKMQTPDINHEESWWQLVMIAYVQLYLAREIAENTLNPWEKYLPAFRSTAQEKAPTQVQKDFGRIIRGIGTPAKPLKPRKKSRGRQLGETQVKRYHYAVVVKKQKTIHPIAITT